MKIIRQSGIVLLEVLVAFSIMAVSITVLLQVASTNVNRHRMIENRLTAASHASNILAEIGLSLPLEERALAGRIDERFSWQLEVKELGTVERQREIRTLIPSLVSLVLVINWQEGVATKNYLVNTKRIIWR